MHPLDDFPQFRWIADLVGRLASPAHQGYALPSAGTRQTTKSRRGKWALRKQAAVNLIHMGHCAPTVMQTLLDVSDQRQDWLVRLSAGMPGGIGNNGHECGAVTSPLVLLGLRHGLRETDGGLPTIFDRGHAHCQQFLARHQTLQCKEIRREDRFPRHCIRPVCMSAELLQDTESSRCAGAIPPGARSCYCRLYAHMAEKHFHCARAVFERLPAAGWPRQQVLDAVSAFMGGTLFMGLTCSALTAGVMAVGLQSAEIENSPVMVVRLLARMTFGGDAFDDKINKFNRTMNAGHRISKWFASEFGSTQCRAITGCDFSAAEGVQKYIDSCSFSSCEQIADRVAWRVQETLVELRARGPEYQVRPASTAAAIQ